MGDDTKAGFARELLSSLPLKEFYADAVAPGARIVGQIGEDVLKAVQLALAPVQLIGVGQDRFRRFINVSRDRVPEERRVLPPPELIGPILESIRYEREGTPIDEMFSHLLSSAIDTARLPGAHPAFPAIIRQLSSDEARILELIAAGQYQRVAKCDYDFRTGRFIGQYVNETDTFPISELVFSININLYIDHLHTLGLAGLYEYKPQEPIFANVNSSRDPKAAEGHLSSGGNQTVQVGTRRFQEYQLTPWGEAFFAVCSKG